MKQHQTMKIPSAGLLLDKHIKKSIRSILLLFPKAYDFIYETKHKYFFNFVLKKVHEQDFNAFKLIGDQDSPFFLDVGANAGQSALSIFTVKPNAKIVSFEPNTSNYAYFYLQKIANKFNNFE